MFRIRTPALNVFLSILGLTLNSHSVRSASCGDLQLLADRSRGVQILANDCPHSPEIASGTILLMAPGARLWLSSTKSQRQLQVVCQSLAESSLTLLVDPSTPPWISSKALQNCQRQKRRWNCADRGKGDKALTCVMAQLDEPTVNSPPRQATSLVLRSLGSPGDQALKDESRRQQILAAVGKDAELCHELYQVGRKFTLTWTIAPPGKVTGIEIPTTLRQLHPQLSSCLADVVKFHTYPHISSPITLSAPL